MSTISSFSAPQAQPRQLDSMSKRLVRSQADTIKDFVSALGEQQNAQPGLDGLIPVSLAGRNSIRFAKDGEGAITQVQLNADSAEPTTFNFVNGNWPRLTSVTVGSTCYGVENDDQPEWQQPNPGQPVKLDAGLAELLKNNGYTTAQMATALDNTSADQTPGIGWVRVKSTDGATYPHPVNFQYDQDGKVAKLDSSVGTYGRVSYEFFQGDLGSISQRNSSYVTVDENVFDFQNGQPTARRYAAWVHNEPLGSQG